MPGELERALEQMVRASKPEPAPITVAKPMSDVQVLALVAATLLEKQPTVDDAGRRAAGDTRGEVMNCPMTDSGQHCFHDLDDYTAQCCHCGQWKSPSHGMYRPAPPKNATGGQP